jgi:ureidoglycolate hydrolase
VVNFGTAIKFDDVASLETSSPQNNQTTARPNLCLFSCQPWPATLIAGSGKLQWRLKGLERHQFSSQTFVPLSTHTRTADPLEQDLFNSQPEGKYLIVVALDRENCIPFFPPSLSQNDLEKSS